jgi:hypothetical protein
LDLDLRVVVEYRRRSNKEELDEEEEDQTRRKEFISQNLSKTLSQWRVETQYSLYVSLFFLKLMLFFLQITKFNTIIICHFFMSFLMWTTIALVIPFNLDGGIIKNTFGQYFASFSYFI